MNKKPSKFREKRGNTHPSQNDLLPIDKFSPDWWYYREEMEEMDEPDDIDISYENESRNRNKKIIRLTESEIKNIISESISKIMEDTYSNPMGRPEGRINPFPQYNSDFDDEEPMFPIPNKPRLHTLDRTTDSFSDWQKGDHAYYDDGEVYPSAEWSDTDMYGKPSHHSQWAIDADKDLEKMQKQRFKDNLDKQWQDTKDKEKYSKMADSRPLHRKGSLNRAMEEAIRKTINKILNEEVDMGLRETIDGLNFAKIKRPNGYETIIVKIDSTIPYISIGSWEAEGQEAQEAIDIISNAYNETGDYNLAIKEYIDNF